MKQKLKTPLAAVTLDVTSNYHDEHIETERDNQSGEDNYTNIWRFMVIGDEFNQLQVA